MSDLQSMFNESAVDAVVMSLFEYICDSAISTGVDEDEIGYYLSDLSVEQWSQYITSYTAELKESNVNAIYEHIAPVVPKSNVIKYLNSLDLPSIVDKIKTIE